MDEIKNRLEIEAAMSVGADVEQIEYVPYLLQDLWELGSFTQVNLQLIKSADVGVKAKVLDLGCGKGAVAINIAKEFGYNVIGIDGFNSFIQVANEKAIQWSVSNLTQFIHADIKEFVQHASGFDIIILSSVGPIWGSWFETVKNLKRCLKENGYLIIDEGFVEDGITEEHYLTHNEILQQFVEAGVKIEKEIIIPSNMLKEENQKNNLLIRRRAEELVSQYPEKKSIIQKYIDAQLTETNFLDSRFHSAVWLLRPEK